jgi:hypothetical protein
MYKIISGVSISRSVWNKQKGARGILFGENQTRRRQPQPHARVSQLTLHGTETRINTRLGLLASSVHAHCSPRNLRETLGLLLCPGSHISHLLLLVLEGCIHTRESHHRCISPGPDGQLYSVRKSFAHPCPAYSAPSLFLLRPCQCLPFPPPLFCVPGAACPFRLAFSRLPPGCSC